MGVSLTDLGADKIQRKKLKGSDPNPAILGRHHKLIASINTKMKDIATPG
jgi:hypothetical protein